MSPWPLSTRCTVKWMGARFVAIVDLTGDDDDTLSHTSDIQVQLPASADVSSHTSAWVHFSQAGRDTRKMFTVSNRHLIRQVWILGNHSIPLHTLEVYAQFLDFKKLFTWSHNEHEKLWTISAKWLDVLFSINKNKFLLPLINMKRLRGKILSVLWQEITKNTITTCRCKFGNSNTKQMRDFSTDKGNVSAILSGSKTELLTTSEKMVKEVTSEVRRWDADTRMTLRNNKSRKCWTESVYTALSRDVWRISSCSISRWTRNWSTSTRNSGTCTRSTTPK